MRPGLIVPAEVTEIVLAAETDAKDPLAYAVLLDRARRKFEAWRLSVTIAWPSVKGDFNTELMAGGVWGEITCHQMWRALSQVSAQD